jgi:hypothetical protein
MAKFSAVQNRGQTQSSASQARIQCWVRVELACHNCWFCILATINCFHHQGSLRVPCLPVPTNCSVLLGSKQ